MVIPADGAEHIPVQLGARTVLAVLRGQRDAVLCDCADSIGVFLSEKAVERQSHWVSNDINLSIYLVSVNSHLQIRLLDALDRRHLEHVR